MKISYNNYKCELIPRFVLEYANFTIQTLNNNEYTRGIVPTCDEIIINSLKARARGLITIDETIKNINNVVTLALERRKK